MSSKLEVESEDFIGAPTHFSIGVEGDTLVVSHPFLMPRGGDAADITGAMTVKFTKGRIAIEITSADSDENFGAIYTQQRNGRYVPVETGNSDFHPEMKMLGEALFQEGIYPDMIGAAVRAVRKLSPEQAMELTSAQQQLLNSAEKLVAQSKPNEQHRI